MKVIRGGLQSTDVEASMPVVLERPTAVDLYAGAGGLSLGMEQAGFDVVLAAEWDPVHALVHRFNMPQTSTVRVDLGAGAPGEVGDSLWQAAQQGSRGVTSVDALVGGPPCQGFSVGGVRNPADERNNQLLRFVEMVTELSPKVFALENVAGLLEPRFADLRSAATRRLEGAGYRLSGFDKVVDAADYGVPQSRKRVVVLGSRIGPAPEMPLPSGRRITVAEAFDGLPDPRAYRRLLSRDWVTLNDADEQALSSPCAAYARYLAGVERDASDMSAPRKNNRTLLTNSLRTVHSEGTRRRFKSTVPGTTERISRLYRLDPAGQSRTLRAGTGQDRGSHTSPRPIHPVHNRVITVREAARLHGYPDWFRFHATNWHGHRQVGNSVPPPLAAAVGAALISALGRATTRPSTEVDLGACEWLRMSNSAALAVLTPR